MAGYPPLSTARVDLKGEVIDFRLTSDNGGYVNFAIGKARRQRPQIPGRYAWPKFVKVPTPRVDPSTPHHGARANGGEFPGRIRGQRGVYLRRQSWCLTTLIDDASMRCRRLMEVDSGLKTVSVWAVALPSSDFFQLDIHAPAGSIRA